jgi:tryptophanase
LLFWRKRRESTYSAQDRGWNQWVEWRKNEDQDFEQYVPNNVLRFLINNQQYSNTHLNMLCLAITSVFTVIHEDKTPIAENQIIYSQKEIKSKASSTTSTVHIGHLYYV